MTVEGHHRGSPVAGSGPQETTCHMVRTQAASLCREAEDRLLPAMLLSGADCTGVLRLRLKHPTNATQSLMIIDVYYGFIISSGYGHL